MSERFDLGDVLGQFFGETHPITMLSARVRQDNLQYSRDQVDWFNMDYLIEKGEKLHTYPHRRIVLGDRVYLL